MRPMFIASQSLEWSIRWHEVRALVEIVLQATVVVHFGENSGVRKKKKRKIMYIENVCCYCF